MRNLIYLLKIMFFIANCLTDFTGLSKMREADSSLGMTDKLTAHLAHTNIGSEKFRLI